MYKLDFPWGQPPPNTDVLWRIDDKYYSVVIDPDMDRYGTSGPYIEARWYEVKKRTPKGAWIDNRFVLLTARKTYACNTIDEALVSFIARKTRQHTIYQTRANKAKRALDIAKEIQCQTKNSMNLI